MGTWGPREHSWNRVSWSLTLRSLRSGAEWQIFYCGSTPIFLLGNSDSNLTPKLLGNNSLQQTSKRNKLTEKAEKIKQIY